MEDITLRALRVLGEVHAVLAEDTRRTRSLYDRHAISLPDGGFVSCHEHNEAGRIERAIEEMAGGRDLALVTDAGTPAISDPGYRLVRAVWEAGLTVVPIPGACAATAALSASGLPTDRFTFAGFPPKKTGARQRWLDELATAPGTLVLYAAAREVPSILDDLVTSRADPEVSIFREITKTYEECSRGLASAVALDWRENPRKGEVTLLAGKGAEKAFDDAGLLELLRQSTAKEVAELTGVSRRHLYQLKLSLKSDR
jgi:16S rRNA (cytidine1402-2'-O)-methyltransferase